MTFQPYTIFEHNNYIETVTNEKNGVRIVDCSESGINKLYRIEHGTNFSLHLVRYTLPEAIQVFTGYSLDAFSVDYRHYTIIYRTLDSDIIVSSETIESDYKPVIHARHEVQILANQRQRDMRYTIFDYTGKPVFNSTAIFQPNNALKDNPYEGIDGYHNQISGYSCANCQDQGCYQCLGASQLYE